jgi:DNA-binding CsgD family transcriptional regulator
VHGRISRASSPIRRKSLVKTLFLHPDVPAGFHADYFEALEHNGPSATQHLARERLVPFTFTEARRLIRPTGEDSWVFNVMQNHGMREGFYCPLQRWAFVYWSPRVVEPGPFERGCLSGAAYLPMLRIEALVPHPERFERQGKHLTAREVEVLRLASTGLTQAQIAAQLEISQRTAEHHIEKAIKRLSAKNITEACVQAVRYKFFT